MRAWYGGPITRPTPFVAGITNIIRNRPRIDLSGTVRRLYVGMFCFCGFLEGSEFVSFWGAMELVLAALGCWLETPPGLNPLRPPFVESLGHTWALCSAPSPTILPVPITFVLSPGPAIAQACTHNARATSFVVFLNERRWFVRSSMNLVFYQFSCVS